MNTLSNIKPINEMLEKLKGIGVDEKSLHRRKINFVYGYTTALSSVQEIIQNIIEMESLTGKLSPEFSRAINLIHDNLMIEVSKSREDGIEIKDNLGMV